MGLVESREREVNILKGYRVVDMELETQPGRDCCLPQTGSGALPTSY